ncbi:MAG: DUF1583 domain-containing protein [Planctomycetaceae bacterium]|nr:DUF1583 domain-containing protein [Planctomycetaceae bacterium]
MTAIFGEAVLSQNVMAICDRAARMDTRTRYDFLKNWVLNLESPGGIRLALDFSPADPVHVGSVASPASDLGSSVRTRTGGEVVSPAADLIRAARKLDRLPSLRQEIVSSAREGESHHPRRLALLAAIDMESHDSASVIAQLRLLLAASSEQQDFDPRENPGLLFALDRLLRYDASQTEIAAELAELSRQFQGKRATSIAARHLKATIHRLMVASTGPLSENPVLESTQWHSVSRHSARSRGTGLNPSIWVTEQGQAANIASHGDDLLYFHVPCRGNLIVEGDLSTFRSRDMEMQVAGHWCAPSITRDKYSTGTIRGTRTYHPLAETMPPVRSEIRSQTIMHDQTLTTSFDGRRIDAISLPADHDPWIAVRSDQFYEGHARNIWIGGQPVVPDQISIVSDRQLSGWISYFDSSIGHLDAQWRPAANPDLIRLIGTRRVNMSGTGLEEAIHYHRPMLEDGVMEMEFYYRSDEIHVHPALDRICFLLKPDGVRIHWLTNGAFDRSGLDPMNEVLVADNQRGPSTLPLKNDAWNALHLKLIGNTVELTLNGVFIYECHLPPENSRSFGLFHYADQTEARVRSIVYRGDWPRQLPARTQQELANPIETELEEDLAALPIAMDHTFGSSQSGERPIVPAPIGREQTTGFPQYVFAVNEADTVNFFDLADDGLRVRRPGVDDDRWYDTILSPQLELHGNFDIVARCTDFEAKYDVGGYGSVGLRLSVDDDRETWCTWIRRTQPQKNGDVKHFLHLMMSQRRDGEVVHEFFDAGPAEGRQGGLRIARRGETLIFLYADGDSPFFRVMKTFPIGREATVPNGLRLMVSSHQAGETQATWKSLRIAATQVTGTATVTPLLTLAELNRVRAEFTPLVEVDFSDPASVDKAFLSQLLPGATMEYQPEGLKVTSPGQKAWSSSNLVSREGISGDFDVQLDFEALKFMDSADGGESTIFVMLEFDGPGTPEIHCKFAIDSQGLRTAETQLRFRRRTGRFDYQEVHCRPVAHVTSLRVARRDGLAYLMFREDGEESFKILGVLPAGTGPLKNSGVQVRVHTGGEERETQVLFKKWSILATPQPLDPIQRFRGLFE